MLLCYWYGSPWGLRDFAEGDEIFRRSAAGTLRKKKMIFSPMPYDNLPVIPLTAFRQEAVNWENWMAAAFNSQPNRWAHVHTVWQRAKEISSLPRMELAQRDQEALELAALLHDVGRAIDMFDSEPHGFVGARFLDCVSLPRIACLVAHHSGALFEALERGCPEKCIWKRELSPVSDLLTFLDMTSDSTGRTVTPDERREDIRVRYGVESYQVKAFDQIATEIARGKGWVDKWS